MKATERGGMRAREVGGDVMGVNKGRRAVMARGGGMLIGGEMMGGGESKRCTN